MALSALIPNSLMSGHHFSASAFVGAAGYWITSSAEANSPSRIVNSSALAVLRLITNS
jgi:hypothetical protein